MHILSELDEHGRHIVAFEHLHRVRALSAPPRTFRYIDDNSAHFNLSALPTDYTLKAIFNASDNGLLTREGMTRTIVEMYRDAKAASEELGSFFAQYDIYAYAQSSMNSRLMRAHGFAAYECIAFLEWRWSDQQRRIDEGRTLDPEGIVPTFKIIGDLKNNFEDSGAILKYCDERTRSGKIKFPSYARRIFNSGAIIKEYKNGSFEVQYTEPIHRLYLTAMRFNERIEKIRTTLEVQDKLAGLLD